MTEEIKRLKKELKEWQSEHHFVEVYNEVTNQTTKLISVSDYLKV